MSKHKHRDSSKYVKQSLRTQRYDTLESLPTKQKIKPRRGDK